MKKIIMPIITIGIVIIVILFIAKVLFVPQDISNMKTINSDGTAELAAPPDQAVIDMHIEVLRDTADLASSDSEQKVNAVTSALNNFTGITVQTTGYSINKQEDWTPNGSVFKGYDAIYNLEVNTTEFNNVGKIIDASVASGVNGVDNVQFELSTSAEEKIRSTALQEASADAKTKAEAMAAGLGVKLGDVVSVSESNIYAQPVVFEKAVAMAASGAPVANLQIQPSNVQVTASITVTYKLD